VYVARRLSYAAPTISGLTGPGALLAPAAGGAHILLRGTNFGPADGSASLRVWAVPTLDASLEFVGVGCVVTEAFVAIRCNTSAAVGAALGWRVEVEGLYNTLLYSSVAPPQVTNASLVAGTVSCPRGLCANTRGNSTLAVKGVNFGPRLNGSHTRVTIALPTGPVDISPCEMVETDTRLQCVLPAGTGNISAVTVTTLGQVGTLSGVNLAYAPPTLVSVVPALWSTEVGSTGLAVSLSGSGFGAPPHFAQIVVTAKPAGSQGSPACEAALLRSEPSVTVQSDARISVVFQPEGAGHIVPSWAIHVVVSGQAMSSPEVIATTRPPTEPVLSLARKPNGTHFLLLLTGDNYGAAVTPCENDVRVEVNGAPCDTLTMVVVSLSRRIVWVPLRSRLPCSGAALGFACSVVCCSMVCASRHGVFHTPPVLETRTHNLTCSEFTPPHPTVAVASAARTCTPPVFRRR
jgi:hypothetical protein